jgi:hypothetical protein
VDISGKLVAKYAGSNNSRYIDINLSAIPRGLYYAVLRKNKEVQSVKIVKE